MTSSIKWEENKEMGGKRMIKMVRKTEEMVKVCFFFIIYIIFYVAMKQPRSTSHTNTKLTKKALLPSFKQPKAQSKIQELSASSKGELFIHAKLIPLEITAERKNGETIKITVNANDLVVQEMGKTYRSGLNFPSLDAGTTREWVELDLGEVCSNIKVRKIGDQNSIGSVSSMVSWDKMESGEKKVGATVSLKDIIKGSHKTIESSTSLTLNTKQDKNKQMKAFVANLMSRKVAKRSSETNQLQPRQPRISLKKRSDIFKSKLAGCEDQLNKNSFVIKMNPPSTAGSILSGISGARSFRKDLNQKANLKQSKFTGKSEKETSIGDQSLFMNNKTNANITTHLSSLQNEDYDKKKQKFDSQPYFYQKSTITSNFSNNNHNESMKKYGNSSRQEQCSSQIKASALQIPKPEDEKRENLGECLKNKSEHESEEEVEEDIKRSAMMDSSVKQSDSEFNRQAKKVKGEESSECFQSKQMESSGTIYESKYQ